MDSVSKAVEILFKSIVSSQNSDLGSVAPSAWTLCSQVHEKL